MGLTIFIWDYMLLILFYFIFYMYTYKLTHYDLWRAKPIIWPIDSAQIQKLKKKNRKTKKRREKKKRTTKSSSWRNWEFCLKKWRLPSSSFPLPWSTTAAALRLRNTIAQPPQLLTQWVPALHPRLKLISTVHFLSSNAILPSAVATPPALRRSRRRRINYLHLQVPCFLTILIMVYLSHTRSAHTLVYRYSTRIDMSSFNEVSISKPM